MADNPLNKLSSPAQVGIAAVLAVAICAGFYFTWWKSAVQAETTKAQTLSKLQGEIQALEVTANKLPEFQREVQLLEASLEKLKLILPTDKQMPDLMKRLQSLTQQASLGLQGFVPGKPQVREFYQELPIAIDVVGNYHNLGLFFDRVGRLIRLVNVGNVRIKTSSKQTATNTVTAQVVATAYIYSDAPPPAPKGAARGAAASAAPRKK